MAGGTQNDGNKPGGPVTWVFEDDDLENLLEAIRVSQKVVVDLETTGLVEYAWSGGPQNAGVAGRVALAAFTLPDATVPMGDEWNGLEPTTWVLPLSHPDSPFRGRWKGVLGRCMRAAVETARPISNVNVKFDARWWHEHTGVDVTHLIRWDPQVSGHALDEHQPRKLKERAPKVFGIERWDDVSFESPGAAERADLIELGSYGARDTYWTWRLEVHDRYEMYLEGRDEGDEPYFPEEVQNARLGQLCTWVAMPSVAALTAIEQRGMRLDLQWTEERVALEKATYREHMDWMIEATGIAPRGESIHSTAHWFKELMSRAVDQKYMHIAALTDGGAPQWSKGVVIRQERQWEGEAESNFAMHLREGRQADKRLSYLTAWQKLADRQGFIRARYNVGSVLTGRLSSSEPNMQQVTKKLRPAFIPSSEDYVIAALDYSQLELRIAAFISRCVPMLEAFARGDDLHRLFAATINGITPEQVTDQQRTQAKAGNFGLLYMMGARGFKEYAETTYGVVLTEKEAVKIYHAFFEQWDGMQRWHTETVASAHARGYVTSPIGRVRRLPGLYDGNDKVVAHAERQAVNSGVQGFGSDLMNIGLASAAGLLPGTRAVKGARAINTVHDEGTFEVRRDRWETIVPELQERMTDVHSVLRRMGCTLDVPLKVDAQIGTRWSLSDVGTM